MQQGASAGGNLVSSIPCDPTDISNIVPAKLGFDTSVYVPAPGSAGYGKSGDYIALGTEISSGIILKDLNVPTRYYSAGFPNGNDVLRDDRSQILQQYYGLKMKTSLKLATGDADGIYELAMLADDGVSVYTVDSNGAKQVLIEDEHDHPTRMACMHQGLKMTATSRIPLEITWYQGPATEIAAVLIWRRLDNKTAVTTPLSGAAGQDPDCGTYQNASAYFDAYSSPMSQPRQAYTDLLKRGWVPVPNANLEISAGSNLCPI